MPSLLTNHMRVILPSKLLKPLFDLQILSKRSFLSNFLHELLNNIIHSTLMFSISHPRLSAPNSPDKRELVGKSLGLLCSTDIDNERPNFERTKAIKNL